MKPESPQDNYISTSNKIINIIIVVILVRHDDLFKYVDIIF